MLEPKEAVAQGIHHRGGSDAGWLVQPVEGGLGLEVEVDGGWTESRPGLEPGGERGPAELMHFGKARLKWRPEVLEGGN